MPALSIPYSFCRRCTAKVSKLTIQCLVLVLLLSLSVGVNAQQLQPSEFNNGDGHAQPATVPASTNAIVDSVPPVVSRCPGPLSFRSSFLASPTCALMATWNEPIAFDAVSGSVPYYRRTHAPGQYFALGRTNVTYYFRDAAGNESTCTFPVDISDDTPPFITCTETVIRTMDATNTYSIPELAASDNCGSFTVFYVISGATIRSGTGNNASGIFNPGINYITWTARDFSGNVSNCTSQVIVQKKGCTLASSFTILSSVTAQGNDGQVKIQTIGGNPPFTYTIGDATNQTGEFSALQAGTYSYIVRDAANCSSEGSFTLGASTATIIDCPTDAFIQANPATCAAKVTWSSPNRLFPQSIPVVSGLYKENAVLTLIGEFNGHAYYKSNDVYKWGAAQDLAKKVRGHLVTINSQQENDFIFNNLGEDSTYWFWLGMYNSGAPGNWQWVTDEPINAFTNWAPGEPNNFAAPSPSFIQEAYAQVRGGDPLHQWNDTRDVPQYFIVEVESPLITYFQLGGVSLGSDQQAGRYPICILRTNLATGVATNCCFYVTITCQPASYTCPTNTVIAADPSTCLAKVTWTAPNAQFPASISLPAGQFTTQGSLVFLGEFMGHGYYRSNDVYSWETARDLSAAAGGHLFTIGSAAEGGFVRDNLNLTIRGPYDPWIGLYNSGTAGSWKWVTDEPFGPYVNWATGEPNNFGGSSQLLVEKYVQWKGISWFDQRADRLPFIAEFEGPTLSYRQVSGPANGSMLSPGTYQVCYEITNKVTNTVSTCCFSVRVTCSGLNSLSAKSETSVIAPDKENAGFSAFAFPNPSQNYFSIQIKSANLQQQVSIQVTDVSGRTLEVKNGIDPNSVQKFGSSFKPGVYYAKVVQGNSSVMLRLVKK